MRQSREIQSQTALPESHPLHQLIAALTPSDPSRIVEYTRQHRNGYYLASYLRLNRPVTPEMADLIEDIFNGKLTAPILEPSGPPLRRDEVLAEIKLTALLLQRGHLRLQREARALGHWPLERKRQYTEAAWAIKADKYGESVRMLRERVWPQKGRGKRAR